MSRIGFGKAIAGVIILSAAAAAASLKSDYRFSRPIEAPAGWCALLLPDDVLDACHPGLPDLRAVDGQGHEVPYAFDSNAGVIERRELTDIESKPHLETTALLDRGRRPPLVRAVGIEILESEFLKPVALEASPDGRTYGEIARGSLFAASGVRSTTLRFAPNDLRFWRFRFDDRNGDPVHAVAVRIETGGAPSALREIPLPLAVSAGDGKILEARLPAANLGVTALRLSIEEPAYDRPVRVFERIFFRDEVSRRQIGAGRLRRSPGGAASNEIDICDPAGRNLEIEIENAGSPALHVTGLTALAIPRRLLFFAPGGPLTLFYGSPSAPAPRYDLASALLGGRPRTLGEATLGAPREMVAYAPLPAPSRGAPIDADDWKTHQPIELPASGNVAYLDLWGPARRDLASLRILDAESRPVPYVVEETLRQAVQPVTPRVWQRGTVTVAVIPVDPGRPASQVMLSASAPEYFMREVTVLEEQRDARGITGDRVLGSAHWEQHPGQPRQSVLVSIAPPRTGSIRAEIENGDNPPLSIDRAAIRMPYVRIDFLFRPGERLTLLSENPRVSRARYDFAMVADRVLASPARPARLGPPESARGRAPLPKWFWAAVAGAALLVAAALARTLTNAQGEAPY